jgi:hypothetical protein
MLQGVDSRAKSYECLTLEIRGGNAVGIFDVSLRMIFIRDCHCHGLGNTNSISGF